MSAGRLRVQTPSGPPILSGNLFQGTVFPISTRIKTPAASYKAPGRPARSVAANALGLGPRDRRCNSCRADQFRTLPWPNTRGTRLLSGTMQVGVLPAAPLPDGVKVARRSVKPFVLVRVQVWQPFQGVMTAADGRLHAATTSERGGCLRTATKVQVLPP